MTNTQIDSQKQNIKESLAERVAALKTGYPAMFDHPGQKPNEICISVQIVEAAFVNASIYSQNGCPSARLGETCMGDIEGQGKLLCQPIFIDAAEFFAAEDKAVAEKNSKVIQKSKINNNLLHIS